MNAMTRTDALVPQSRRPDRAANRRTSRMLRRTRAIASTSLELMGGLARNGRLWLVPLVAVMGLCGALLGVVTVIEYVAPFVYTIF